jgi:hypothetical protein
MFCCGFINNSSRPFSYPDVNLFSKLTITILQQNCKNTSPNKAYSLFHFCINCVIMLFTIWLELWYIISYKKLLMILLFYNPSFHCIFCVCQKSIFDNLNMTYCLLKWTTCCPLPRKKRTKHADLDLKTQMFHAI